MFGDDDEFLGENFIHRVADIESMIMFFPPPRDSRMTDENLGTDNKENLNHIISMQLRTDISIVYSTESNKDASDAVDQSGDIGSCTPKAKGEILKINMDI